MLETTTPGPVPQSILSSTYPSLGRQGQAGRVPGVLPEEEGEVVPGHVISLSGEEQQSAPRVWQEVEGEVQVTKEEVCQACMRQNITYLVLNIVWKLFEKFYL